MKYVAVIDTDDYEDFEFFEDGNGKYLHGIDAGSVNGEWICLYFKEAPKEEPVLVPCEYRENDYANGYNQALIDCGVLEDEN